MGRLIALPLAFIALASFIVPASVAWAHPGGLDASGCHTNRKTGEYHCHRATTTPKSPPRQASTGASSRSAGTYYANCAQARAAGAAPLRRGDPGYRAGLDRDDDGVACE
ncbi:MAG TPA: excalibur calcium-binding domain-containing protein [Sphingomonadaceae bacterium]|nr:excalibur calcium-binding domain-containing protein [Sphingomonadaceae bacterium]